MSHTALYSPVQSLVIPTTLDSNRLEFYNYRLNLPGRKIISRMLHNNEHLLLTQPAFEQFRALGYVTVIKEETLTKEGKPKIKHITKIDKDKCELYLKENIFKIIPLQYYPSDIAKMYSDLSKVSFRSIFISEKYFETLNHYGHNREKVLSSWTSRNVIAALNEYLKPWATNSIFEFNIEEEFNSGRWLTHIKTNSNSGYPANIKQTKQLMIPAATASLKIFKQWLIDPNIDWKKLSFEMGYRTERAMKHRVICMASQFEKPISAIISTFLDVTAQYLPFNLPRKFGAFKNVAQAVFEHNQGTLFSKDFDAFDTSVPLELCKLLRDWFRSINNTFCNLVAFEIDLIIHSYMIVNPNRAFHIAALPSGIGITQFFGSIIHWLADLISNLETLFSCYQSDDNIAVTKLNAKELQACCDVIKKEFGMDISPVGKKSFISDDYNKFLQKVLDRKNKVFFNQEARAYTNAYFRERELSDDITFEQLFGIDDPEANKSKKAVLAYLGNLVSFGEKAISFPRIMSTLYGRTKTGFTTTQVKWGLNNLEAYMSQYLAQEQHRPIEDAGWLKGIFEAQLQSTGWSTVTPTQIATTAQNIGLKLHPSVLI